MAEGIHAKITADSTNFVSAVDSARLRAFEFKKALTQVKKGAVDFTPAINNTFRPLTQMRRQTQSVTKNFKLMKGATQQIGFQIQDFAVQVGSGQSAMVAFGQQASQLAGILGPGGAVIGAVIAVGAAIATGLIPALTSGADEMQRLTDKVNGFNKSLQTTKLFDLNDKLALSSERIQGLDKSLLSAQRTLETLEAGPGLGAFGSPGEAAAFAAGLDNAREKVLSLSRAVAFETATFEGLEAQLKQLENVGFDSLSDVTGAGGGGGPGAANKKRGAGAVFEKDPWLVALELRQAAQAESDALLLENQLIFAAAIESAEDESFNRRTETLRDFLGGQSGMIQHNLGGIVEMTRKSQGMQAAVMAASFGSILSSTATFSKKAFKLNQAFAIGDAIVSAYQGISKTLAAYPFPISAAMAAAQGAMAFAQVRAIKAQTFGGAGGGGGGASTALPGAVGTTQTGPQAPADNQIVTINLEGEVFGKEQIRGLLGQLNEALDDGATLRIS